MTTPHGAYPLVQLMASPDTGAEIFFDFNDGLSWPEHDGFTLGAPPLLGDPGGVGADYGYRTLSFTVVVQGDEASAMRQHTELARQLVRDSMYLRFQLSEEAPSVWFRCVRSSPGESSMADVYLDRYEQQWRIAVALVAEPFGIGERVTHVLNVKNDPALGGLSTVLTDIRGDAPAPLDIDISPASDPHMWFRPWISTCPLEGSRTYIATPHYQAETASVSGGIVQIGATAQTYSSSARVRFDLIGSEGANTRRLTWSAVKPPFAGRWRIFTRLTYMHTGVQGDKTVTIRGAGNAATSPRRTDLPFPSETIGEQEMLVDLGVFTFPRGNMPTSRPYEIVGDEVGIDVAWTGEVGTGYLWFDYIVLVPVDLPLDTRGSVTSLNFRERERTRGNIRVRINSEEATVQEVGATTEGIDLFRRATAENPAGAFPMVTPGATNVLTFLPRRAYGTGGLGFGTAFSLGADVVADVATLTVSYRPRWLWMPGA